MADKAYLGHALRNEQSVSKLTLNIQLRYTQSRQSSETVFTIMLLLPIDVIA